MYNRFLGAISGTGALLLVATAFIKIKPKNLSFFGASAGPLAYLSNLDDVDRASTGHYAVPTKKLSERAPVRPISRFSFDLSSKAMTVFTSGSNDTRERVASFIPPVLQPGEKRPEFVMKFDFVAEFDDELSLRRGDRAIGLLQANDEWWIVRSENTNQQGLVPVAFMEEVFPDAISDYASGSNLPMPENPGIPDFM